jgi:predicted transposase YbfD/YdcC
LADVPDPRQARGKRHAWSLILILIGAALLSGPRNVRAIGQWVAERRGGLVELLRPPQGRLPSTPTLRRALRAVDVAALEQRIAASARQAPAPAPRGWIGQAVDGKAVRGANLHGAQVHPVSLVRHGDGVVLGQVRVADKGNEITAAPRLLTGRDPSGTVTTTDALLTQRGLAAQIRQQGGHYLMVVKANQPARYTAIQRLFTEPPVPLASDCVAPRPHTEQGHGRLERRTLARRAALNDYLDWPGVGQVRRRTDRAVDLATGTVHHEVTYGLTSLPPQQATGAAVAARWRDHWTIEHRVHSPRAAPLGEDPGPVRVGHAPQALAALRNGRLNLLRRQGWVSSAAAPRH